jgi:hypothetical protein
MKIRLNSALGTFVRSWGEVLFLMKLHQYPAKTIHALFFQRGYIECENGPRPHNTRVTTHSFHASMVFARLFRSLPLILSLVLAETPSNNGTVERLGGADIESDPMKQTWNWGPDYRCRLLAHRSRPSPPSSVGDQFKIS